jgi:hypothetical protein
VRLLSQFVSPYTGRIYGRHITGLCKQKQKLVEEEIEKAQVCGKSCYNPLIAGGLQWAMKVLFPHKRK